MSDDRLKNRVFVSHLDHKIDETRREEREEFFSNFGAVKSCKIIRMPVIHGQIDHFAFAFVIFEDADGMEAAVDAGGPQWDLMSENSFLLCLHEIMVVQ